MPPFIQQRVYKTVISQQVKKYGHIPPSGDIAVAFNFVLYQVLAISKEILNVSINHQFRFI
jgi:hypothetical protein